MIKNQKLKIHYTWILYSQKSNKIPHISAPDFISTTKETFIFHSISTWSTWKINIQMASANSEAAYRQLLSRMGFVWKQIPDPTASEKWWWKPTPGDFELHLYKGNKTHSKTNAAAVLLPWKTFWIDSLIAPVHIQTSYKSSVAYQAWQLTVNIAAITEQNKWKYRGKWVLTSIRRI